MAEIDALRQSTLASRTAPRIDSTTQRRFMLPSSPEITTLLKAWRRGDRGALDRLTPLVYDHLRRLARQYVRKEHSPSQLDATALVHEAFVRLVDAQSVNWQDRAHFYAVSARIMRRI